MAAVDRRYARALAQVVAEQKLNVNDVEYQLTTFAGLLNDNAELREVLANPSIPEQQKLNVLDALAARLGLSGAVRNFVAVVTHHDRLGELSDMVSSFHAIGDTEMQITEAEVVSAHPLDDSNRRLLEAQIARMTGGQRVKATYTQDASLLGGAVVKVGSTVYDGSVRAQLEQLKQRLVNAAA